MSSVFVIDNAGGNSVDASADGSGKTLLFAAGADDSFKGGFDTEAVYVAASSVGSDRLQAGSGTSFLNLDTQGSADLSGVSGFDFVSLSAGNTAVSLGNANFAGLSARAITVSAVAGNNEIDGSGVGGANHPLIMAGGAGSDTMFGGAGNDEIIFGTGSDTVAGGGGSNSFIWDQNASIGKTQTILDFKAVPGGDLLDLSQLVTNFNGNAGSYVDLVDTPTGTNVFFDPLGHGNFGGQPVASLSGDHGLGAAQLIAQHNLAI